ncbi:hypothetical protein V5799_030593 [Amblyomma americanum]|uniref:Uncharacterized protein n=1 Tax=Amblyomma americanum TaxID=6943 RepID=A0AAQ4EMN6_AMBAM
MESDPRAHAYAPVTVLNREGPYMIVALLGMSILGCGSVLVYSFSNYSKLKRSAEELRNYIIDSQTKVAHQQSEDGVGSGAVDTGSTVTPAANAGNQLSADADVRNRSGASVGHGTNEAYHFVAQEVPASADPATAALSILATTNATRNSFAEGQ